MEQSKITLPSKAISALRSGKKVEAIKLTRETLNLTLKDALDAVDQHMANNPEIQEEFRKNRGSSSNITPFVMLLLLIVIIFYSIKILVN